VLIEAVRSLPETIQLEVNIYGNIRQDPDYADRLKAIAGDDARISFCGTFPNERIGEIFEKIDVLVVPSIWFENTPLVIYSALAAGCPVIATDLGGLSEVIEDRINGLLFRKGDVTGLAEISVCWPMTGRCLQTSLIIQNLQRPSLCTLTNWRPVIPKLSKAEGEKMKCLVLGGGGFIGINLCERLLLAGHSLRVFERPRLLVGEKGSDPPVLPFQQSVEWVEGDFSNPADVEGAVAGCDVVFHLICTTLPKSSNENPVYDIETNLASTVNLLEKARNTPVKKIVFISSGGTVYGSRSKYPSRRAIRLTRYVHTVLQNWQ